MEIDVGRVVAKKYELIRLVGMGAMGQVWTARHATLLNEVAIKLMTTQLDGRVEALRRFQIEAQVAANLSRKSRHIVSVSDHGEDDGIAYLVMEMLDGMTLEERLGSEGSLPIGTVADVVKQVAKGLSVAHAEGVTHRDIKPGNLFLGRDEEGRMLAKLLDFGIARLSKRLVAPPGKQNVKPTKLTMRGVILGSTLYMSPEQAMGDELDTRSDVWALAVVAFEAIAGVTPFDGEDADTVLQRICFHRASSLRSLVPSASEALELVFRRAFARRIEDRFQSADQFANALSSACGTELMPIAPYILRRPAPAQLAETAAEPAPLPRSSNTGLIVAISAIVTLGSIGAVALMLRAKPQVALTVPTTALSAPPAVASPIATLTPASPSSVAREVTPPPVVTTQPQEHAKPRPPASGVAPIASTPIDKSAIF